MNTLKDGYPLRIASGICSNTERSRIPQEFAFQRAARCSTTRWISPPGRT
ncbi:MAG: hypothetical protein HYV94_05455 [Candidatus Rokubacteria bacterium]|nr:hypothetical protein [Candidatus Rokubacteria bacterium]MBI4627194.1 hypothetical protein [Candidatus Rokubacteria bacterium]